MKNVVAVVVVAGFLATSAFAAKPDNPGENGKAYGHLSKEDRMVVISEAKENRIKPVIKAYLYFSGTSGDARYDYADDSWAMLLIKQKKDIIKFHAHHLSPDTDYELWYDGNEIETGKSDSNGNLRINAEFTTDNPDLEKFTLEKGDDTVLVSRANRLKGMPDED